MDFDNAPERLRTLPSWLIGQLAIEARRAGGEVLSGHGLRHGHYALLASLDEFGPLSQAALSDRSGLDRGDVVRWIDDLESRRLAARLRDPKDRRRNTVTITTAGGRLLDKIDIELHTAQGHLLRALSATEQARLAALLTRALATPSAPPSSG
jgi:DNA-binding MarR family transcriptional regulator